MSTAPNPRHVITRKVADHLGFVLSAAQLQRLHRVIDRLADGDDADLAARCTPGSAAFDELAASVLVGETYWFRDQRQLQVIADLLADRPPERRRIWSAGCSTGQEAWSLLITLHRAGVWPAEVVATDIHGPSVHTAALGAYPLVRQRGLDADTAATYGAAEGPTWTVREDLRRRLTAVRHDLLRDAPLPADVIICRNVLIYLTATAATTALNRFAGALQGDGVLVLGHAETPMARSGWMIEGHGDVHLLRPDLAPSPTRSISDAPPARGTARGADRPAPTPDVPPRPDRPRPDPRPIPRPTSRCARARPRSSRTARTRRWSSCAVPATCDATTRWPPRSSAWRSPVPGTQPTPAAAGRSPGACSTICRPTASWPAATHRRRFAVGSMRWMPADVGRDGRDTPQHHRRGRG
jgi:chemotaxis methyl-accepting protein methylase